MRELRLERAIAQSELAERAEVTPEYVSRIERGLVGPSMDVIEKIARALAVEPWALFDFSATSSGRADAQLLELADIYRHSTPDDRRLLLRLARALLQHRRRSR